MISTELQAIYVMWIRQLKRFVRARSRLIANIIQPFFFLAFLGMGFQSVRFPGLTSNLSYIDFLAPGMIAMSVIFSSMFAGVSVIWDKQFGFLKEVLVAPVSRLSIVIGRVIGGSTIAVIQGLIILGISFLLGVKIILLGILPSIVFMILTAFFSAGLGLAIASKLEDFHGFQLIMNLIMMPLIFLSTAFFPIESVPSWMKLIIRVNPLAYSVDGLRGCLIGLSSFSLPVDLAVMIVLCTITVALGAYLFNRCEV